jgi:ubiquinol-cytochrome c reductase cytochrome b subunit
MKPAEGTYLLIARLGLVYYFVFFLVLTPVIGKFEKPNKIPASISDAYSENNKDKLRSQENKY